MPNNLVLPKSSAVSSSGSRSRSAPVVGTGGNGVGGLGSSSRVAHLSPKAALAVLSAGKLSRVASAFISFAYLDSAVALPLYLFFVTAGASLCLLALQRPWKGRRIGAKRGKKIFIAGAVMALMLYVWSAGLRSAGPLRALLIDGAELPLLYVFSVISGRELAERRKTRGAFLMIAAYLLLIWDASGHAPDIAELEQTRLAQKAEASLGKFSKLTAEKLDKFAHDRVAARPPPLVEPDPPADDGRRGGARRRRRLLLWEAGDNAAAAAARVLAGRGPRRRLMHVEPRVPPSGSVRDAFVEGTPLRAELGVVLVLAASVVMQASRPFSRRLASELGGAKRHFALTVTASSAVLSPLAALSYLSSSSGALLSMNVIGSVERVAMNPAHVLGFALVGFLWLVLPYYIRAIVSTAMDQRTMLQAGVVVPFAMASLGSAVFGLAARAGGLSWILTAAFLLDAVGLSMMMAGGGAKRALSELPLDARSSMTSINGSQSRSARRGD